MRNLGLDLLKIFSCIGVVALHSTMPGFTLEQYNVSAYLYYLGTYAIPLFFMVNGYFLLNKKELTYSYVFSKIAGILTVVSVWNILIWLVRRVKKNYRFISSKRIFLSILVFWIVNNNIFDVANNKKRI